MTKVEKLNELKTYVRERMDLHNDWSGKSNIKKMFEELETELEELENELKEYRKLQSEVHRDMEMVWMFDSAVPLDDRRNSDRVKLIERVFYKIGNEWIGGDGLETQKRTDPERWESLDDMDGSWTEDDIKKGHHLPF